VDPCPMTQHGPWAVEIKKGIPGMACSKAHMFPRQAPKLQRCLQDVRTGDVIMVYKLCGHGAMLQCNAVWLTAHGRGWQEL
jgi:hypothetical protein